jgi:site-specific DNA recombinase
MTRAAIYCRISKDREDERLGVARQEKDCRDIAAKRGWEVIEPPYIDNDISAAKGGKKVRSDYVRLLDDIEAGLVDAVIIWMEDRLQRQVIELAEFLKVCDAAGVSKIASIGGEFDLSDPDQRTMLYIKAAMAEAEIDKMKRRQKRKHIEKAEHGRPSGGGRRGFGEFRAGVDQEQVAREQELIREAARRILAGDTLRGIALDWHHRGIRTPGTKADPDGNPWGNATLRQLLLSPRVAGQRSHHGQLYPGDPATMPAIVPEPTWSAVKAILEDPERVKLRGGAARYLLTGLVVCGRCDKGMVGTRRVRTPGVSQPQRHYTCRGDWPYGGCRRVSRLAEPVEELICGALFEAVESPEWDRVADRPTGDPTRELYERLARDQARLDRLDDEQVLAALDDDRVKAASLRRVRRDIEERMERTRNRAARMRGDQVVAAIPRNLRDVWDGLSLDRQRAILAVVIERVVIHPQQGRTFDPSAIEVVWRA